MIVSNVCTDQSVMSKSVCYKRRDDVTDVALAAHSHTTTTVATPHAVVRTPDQQSVTPAQVGLYVLPAHYIVITVRVVATDCIFFVGRFFAVSMITQEPLHSAR